MSEFIVNASDVHCLIQQTKIVEKTSAGSTAARVSIHEGTMSPYGLMASNAAQLPPGLRQVDNSYNIFMAGPRGVGDPARHAWTNEFAGIYPRICDASLESLR